MNPHEGRENSVGTRYGEHLREDIPLLQIEVSSYDATNAEQTSFSCAVMSNGTEVRYGRIQPESGLHYTSAGDFHIVSSPIDEHDKFSAQFSECFGLVGLGVGRDSGEQQSFLSHINPHFVDHEPDALGEHLEAVLQQLVQTSEGRTIDAQLVAGRVDPGNKEDRDAYVRHVTKLGEIVKKYTGFSPLVLPPKFVDIWDVTPTMYVDNLYLKTNQRSGKLLRASSSPAEQTAEYPSTPFTADTAAEAVEQWSR